MAEIFKLRGAAAFSATRLSRLTETAKQVLPRLKSLAAEHWYFAEIEQPLSEAQSARLKDLLSAHPAAEALPRGTLLLVTPRLGTISPWSSKATEIARQCGFDAVRRIERGTAYFLDAGGVLDAAQQACVLPLIHDRMIDAVLTDAEAARALFHHYAPQPLRSVAVFDSRARGAGRCQRRTRPGTLR